MPNGNTLHVLTSPSGSGVLNKAVTNDDFPAPVRPATPTFSLSEIHKLILFKVGGAPFKYDKDKFRNVKVPFVGHDSGGRLSSLYPGSDSILV